MECVLPKCLFVLLKILLLSNLVQTGALPMFVMLSPSELPISLSLVLVKVSI